jgi:hypothetical protein
MAIANMMGVVTPALAMKNYYEYETMKHMTGAVTPASAMKNYYEYETMKHMTGAVTPASAMKNCYDRMITLVTRNYQRGLPVGNMFPSAARGVCRCFRFTDR